MTNSPETLQVANGLWSFHIDDDNIFFASVLRGAIWNNMVELRGLHSWNDNASSNHIDFTIELKDRILGNGKQDLPENGHYLYPVDNELIKVIYRGNKNGEIFEGTAQHGEITICHDTTKQLYYGHLSIQFLVGQTSRNIKSVFGISIP
ncbi:hypothetical protein [Pseudomonas sp. BGI-2]|uniref:hypothetical protein n=1 Tax=Pseudomonas sp. BGI-2 TaxID=2528211 RepID=UPI0010350766|nr:hypothetical protein [Pseudomonas sp. BGI-2]TBN49392.1 hypothetical protein EYC95_04790 [Pseudomonas sp. BGI-2]